MWRNRIVERTSVKASELLDHEGNWRIHPEAQKAGMVGVLNEVGIIDALTTYISERQGGLTVIDGHLRKSIDPEQEWPVDILDVDDAEADYILATKDPLAAAASADREKLGALLHNVKTGEAGVQALLGELAEREGVVFGGNGQPPEDPGPQVDKAAELLEKWGIQPGDLWVIPSKTADGEHRVICGDCTDAAVVERVMGGEKAGAVVTDPPYGMNLNTDYSSMPETRIASKTYDRVEGDTQEFDASPFITLFDYVKEQFWWGGDYYYPTLPPNGSWLVWDKRSENSDGLVGNHFELCWSRTPHRRRMIRHHWAGVNARNSDMRRVHPTEKPIDVLCTIISDYIQTGVVIVDLFLGSGTLFIACERLGRLGRGVEIEPKYVAVTLERLAGMGLEPRRVG